MENSYFTTHTKPLLNKVNTKDWVSECKQDVLDILTEVQIGYISARRAAELLFPELK